MYLYIGQYMDQISILHNEDPVQVQNIEILAEKKYVLQNIFRIMKFLITTDAILKV